MAEIITELAEVLAARKQADPETSYVASLYAGGTGRILEKVEEEANELVAAAKTETAADVIHETADLWFHSLVLLAHLGIHPAEILAELERRFGASGHEEKANRKQ